MLNRIEIIGNVVADAEVKTSAENNKEFVVCRVAVNDNFSEEKRVTYYDVYLNKNGIFPYLKKGKMVYVAGKPSFQASVKDGKAYVNISISSKEIELIGGSKE